MENSKDYEVLPQEKGESKEGEKPEPWKARVTQEPIGLKRDALHPENINQLDEILELKKLIERYFRVYEVRGAQDAIGFYCDINEETLDKRFDDMRNEMKASNYIPLLLHEGGEYIIYVTKRPRARYKSSKVNIVLLFLTVITTTISGSILWVGATGGTEADIFSLKNLAYGALYFALPLLAILGTHEFGHYFTAKKHGVAASLPFFIPMIPPLGTLGAVISMREPIPNKKALLDIGAAGPIAGMIVAIPVTIIGIHLTNVHQFAVTPDEPGGLLLFSPLLIIGLNFIFPIQENLIAHPTYFAGWVGILVTALNLLPAGQLDGGHIVRAIFGRKARQIGLFTVILIIMSGFVFGYFGYIFLIVIVMFLGGGLQHPPPLNDVTKLDSRRFVVGGLALVIFISCFHPAPIQPAPLARYDFDISSNINQTMIAPGNYSEFYLYLNNTGETEIDAHLILEFDNITYLEKGWNATLTWEGISEIKVYNITDEEALEIEVEAETIEELIISVFVPKNASAGDSVALHVTSEWEENEEDTNLLSEGVKPVDKSAFLAIDVDVG